MKSKGLIELTPDLEKLVTMLMKNCGFEREVAIDVLCNSIKAVLGR